MNTKSVADEITVDMIALHTVVSALAIQEGLDGERRIYMPSSGAVWSDAEYLERRLREAGHPIAYDGDGKPDERPVFTPDNPALVPVTAWQLGLLLSYVDGSETLTRYRDEDPMLDAAIRGIDASLRKCGERAQT